MTNNHLNPVFEKILPALKNAGVDFWVIGGVAVAATVGKYIRENPDVDTIIRQEHFEKASKVLQIVCNNEHWKFESSEIPVGRPKKEVFIDSAKAIFSMAPACFMADKVKIVFKPGNSILLDSRQFSDKTVSFNNYYLRVPDPEAVKDLFKSHIKHLFSKNKTRDDAEKYIASRENMPGLVAKYRKDSQALFGTEDLLGLIGM